MQDEVDTWRRRKRDVRIGKNRSLAVVDTGGEGPAAILLHGYTDTSRSYQFLARHLGRFRLVIPDLPGHGDSDEDPGVDLSTLAADMKALADTLQIAPSLIIGHSFGSLLALEVARRKFWPEMRVVLLAGSARPALGGLEFLEPIRAFKERIEPQDPFLSDWYAGPVAIDGLFIEAVRGEAARMPVRIWHRYLELLHGADLHAALSTIDACVLSITGGRDELFDARHADMLSRGLPHVCDVRLPDRGHNPHWETPEKVAQLIARWLATGRGRQNAGEV